MATEDEISAAAFALMEQDNLDLPDDEQWIEPQTFHRIAARAALDAAASVRAEAGTEGMEILRAVAQIGLWCDIYPDSLYNKVMNARLDNAITVDHVRQARAIVAAAEQGRVVTPASLEELDTILNRPGPDVVVNEDGSCSPSPQPPAPAEGGTDVAGIARDLLHAHKAWMTGGYPEGAGILFLKAADALTTQAAEIASVAAKTMADVLQTHPYLALAEAHAAQVKRIAALEAALRPFADLARAYPRSRFCAPEDVVIFRASDVRVTLADLDRAALSGKEPQQP